MNTQSKKQLIVAGTIGGVCLIAVLGVWTFKHRKPSLDIGSNVSNGAISQNGAVSSEASAVSGTSASKATSAGKVAGTTGEPDRTVASATDSSQAPGATAPTESAPQSCFKLTFHHKPVSSHKDDEACSQHRNVVKLRHDKANTASLCIRVNNVPVKFKPVSGKSDEFMIGAVAGPHAKITASYCLGKSKCAEDCVVPRDEFMEAIGGEGSEASRGLAGKWETHEEGEKDSGDVTANLDSDLKKELSDIDENAADSSDETYVFSDWKAEADAPSCGAQQVAANHQ